jgi:pimeloyl-ACP methyl ester carboxylesterase
VSGPQRIEGAGVELAAEVGDGRAPVLLVHDLAADRRSFAPLVAALGGGERAAPRTIAYDRRGYGDSGAPEPYEGTTVQEQAQDAVALLRALDAAGGDAVAVGDGFGALVVLDLLVRLPGLLRGAVLVAPPLNQLSDSAAAVLSEQRALLEAALRDGGPAAAVEAWRPSADDGVRAAHRAFFADFGGLASWPVARRELRAVAVPVFVVTGSGTPPHLVEAADRLADLLGDGRRMHGGAAEGEGAGDPLPALRELLGA